MDETSSSSSVPGPTATVGAATVVTLPRFWAEDVVLWFLQVENKFRIHHISSQTRRYELLLDALPQEAASEVRDVLMLPLSTTPYDDVKDALLSRLAVPEESRIQQLLSSEELGDRRPTQFLRHLQKLLGDKAATFDTAVLKELFLQRMPVTVRVGLAIMHSQPLPKLAELADRILETSAPTVAATHSGASSTDIADLRSMMHNLTTEVAELRRKDQQRSSSPRSSSFRGRRVFRRRHSPAASRAASPSSGRTAARPCYYHRRFGVAARKCEPPCSWPLENDEAGR